MQFTSGMSQYHNSNDKISSSQHWKQKKNVKRLKNQRKPFGHRERQSLKVHGERVNSKQRICFLCFYFLWGDTWYFSFPYCQRLLAYLSQKVIGFEEIELLSGEIKKQMPLIKVESDRPVPIGCSEAGVELSPLWLVAFLIGLCVIVVDVVE